MCASTLLHRLHTVALVQLPIYASTFLGTRTLSVAYSSFAMIGRGASPKIGSTPFHRFGAFQSAWRQLGGKQILVPSHYNGKVGVRPDLDEFLKYISTQEDILDTMSFPLLDGERPYVLIVRADGLLCGCCPWVQLAIGFANHGQKARTLAYNWTIDVALTSEHDIDALRT